jgi:hypothetical protein
MEEGQFKKKGVPEWMQVHYLSNVY